MKLFKKFMATFTHSLEASTKNRALLELRYYSPDTVRQYGYSPELLAKGLSAWPWRLEEPRVSSGISNDPYVADESTGSERHDIAA